MNAHSPIANRLALRTVERRKQGMAKYGPANPKCRQFHLSDANVKCIFGANRSSKTHSGCAEVVSECEGSHPLQAAGKRRKPPVEWRVIGVDFPNGIEKVLLPKFKELATREKLKGGSWDKAYSAGTRTLTWANGSFVEFMSQDQDLNKFGGVSRDGIWYDEEPDQDIRDEGISRLIERGGREIFTMTPEKGCTWVYDEFYLPWEIGMLGDRSVECWTLSIWENKYLDRKFIDEADKKFTDPVTRAIKLEGKFVQRSGLIFGAQYFNNRTPWVYNQFKIPQSWPRYVGIDTHTRKKNGVVFVAVSPSGELWAFDEIFWAGPMPKLAEMIRTKLGGVDAAGYFIDWAAKGEDSSYGVSLYDDLLDNGIPCDLALKDPAMRIQKLWKLLTWDPNVKPEVKMPYDLTQFPAQPNGGPLLHICRQTCMELIWQMMHYVWAEYAGRRVAGRSDPPDKARKKDDDLIDALGYLAMENLEYFQLPPEKKKSSWDDYEEDGTGADESGLVTYDQDWRAVG